MMGISLVYISLVYIWLVFCSCCCCFCCSCFGIYDWYIPLVIGICDCFIIYIWLVFVIGISLIYVWYHWCMYDWNMIGICDWCMWLVYIIGILIWLSIFLQRNCCCKTFCLQTSKNNTKTKNLNFNLQTSRSHLYNLTVVDHTYRIIHLY